MPEPLKITLASETIRHLREGTGEVADIWRYEGRKQFIDTALHLAGGNPLGELMLRRYADVQTPDPRLATDVGGMRLIRPIGVAPGYDKKGTMARAWEVLGAGHVTTGGFARSKEEGAPMVRFRTFDNHVGDCGRNVSLNNFRFPNPNTKVGAENIHAQREKGATIRIIGQITVLQHYFYEDFTKQIPGQLARAAYALLPYVNAISIGLSSSSVEGMRAKQHEKTYIEIVKRLQDMMAVMGTKTVPIILKGDGDDERRRDMYCAVHDETGVILELINSTALKKIKAKYGAEQLSGGLAGADADYQSLARETVADVYEKTGAPIIGVGGINSGEQAMRMLRAGASALSVLSAIFAQGLGVIAKFERELSQILNEQYPEITSLDQLIGADTNRGPKIRTK